MRTRSFLSRLQNCLESIFMTSFTNRKAEEAPSPKVGSVSLSLSPLAILFLLHLLLFRPMQGRSGRLDDHGSATQI